MGLSTAMLAVLLSPWLRVREVEVAGARRSDWATLERVASRLLGRPLLSPAPFRAAEELERGEPWILQVEVALRLPGRVVLKVHERRPVFWVQVEGRRLALSADGVALGWVGRTKGLCRLEGVAPPAGPGDLVRGEEFLSLRALYFALRRAGVRGVEAVGASKARGLYARIERGTVITFGDLGGIEAKAERARAVLHYLGDRRALVELLSPDIAVWRPLDEEGVKGG